MPWSVSLVVCVGYTALSVQSLLFSQFGMIFLQSGNLTYEARLREKGVEVFALKGFPGLAASATLSSTIAIIDNIIGSFLAPLVGSWSDRFFSERYGGRRKRWYALSVPLACVFFALMGTSRTIPQMAGYVSAWAVGLGLARPAYTAYSGDLFNALQRGRHIGLQLLSVGLASGALLLASGKLFDRYGFIAVTALGAAYSALAIVVPLLLVREPRQPMTPKGKWLGGDDGSRGERGVVGTIRQLWRTRNIRATLLLLVIFNLNAAASAVKTSISSFATFSLGIKPSSASSFSVIFAAAFTLTALPAGALFRLRRHMYTASLVSLAVLVTLSLATAFFLRPGPRASTLYAGLMAVVGVFAAITSVCIQQILVREAETTLRMGAIAGLMVMVTTFSGFYSPLTVGYLADRLEIRWRVAFFFASGHLAFALLLFLASAINFAGREKPPPTPATEDHHIEMQGVVQHQPEEEAAAQPQPQAPKPEPEPEPEPRPDLQGKGVTPIDIDIDL
jgi:MFS family permease